MKDERHGMADGGDVESAHIFVRFRRRTDTFLNMQTAISSLQANELLNIEQTNFTWIR